MALPQLPAPNRRGTMITRIATIGDQTYEVESKENGRHYLLVKVGMRQIERIPLEQRGYVAACGKAEEIVAERTESQQPA